MLFYDSVLYSQALNQMGVITKHYFCWHRQHGLSETIRSVSFMMVTSALIKELLLLILHCRGSSFSPFL